MNFDFIGSCGRKHKFKTEKFALDVLAKGEKSGKFVNCHVYLCNFCLLYHIGHIPAGMIIKKPQNIDIFHQKRVAKLVPEPLRWVEDGFTYMNVPKKDKLKYKFINKGWEIVNRGRVSFLRKKI